MIRRSALLASLLVVMTTVPSYADGPEVGSSQNNYERTIQAVVRDKRFYKAGNIELGIDGGLTPYDSTYNNYFAGGRLTWHISDHYGWEIVDYQHPFSTVAPFTTNLVTNAQIVDLQAVKLKNIVGTAFKVSPFYGKIRFFGSQVIFLDIYAVLGFGAVNSETHKFNFTTGDSIVTQGWNPSLNYGLGFSFYLSNNFTLQFDLRNYMAYTPTFGKSRFYSHFVFTGGFSMFLPGFG